jgi:hypothetical protein
MNYNRFQIADQAAFMIKTLQNWVQDKGGTAQIVYDLDELWSAAFLSVDKPVIYLSYMGEEMFNDEEFSFALGRVKRFWTVILKFGKSVGVNRGVDLTKPSAVQESKYNWIEEVRDLIRGMMGLSQVIMVGFERIEPVKNSLDEMVNSWRFDFHTLNDLPTMGPAIEPENNLTNQQI